MSESVIIRKSPIVIVRNFAALQFASAGAYILAGSLAYYAQIWRARIGLDIPFPLAQAVFIFVIELALTLYIFLSWYRQTVKIESNQVIYDQGILFRHHTVVSLAHVASATFTQSILGKLTHYGTVRLCDAVGAVLLRLDGIGEPRQFIDQLMRDRPSSVIDVDPKRLVEGEEQEHLERKSTLRWDLATGKVNKNLERSAMKTVAAFLNTGGGTLVLGVADDRTIIGLGQDYATI
jgi:membrane protein YdbS with pleckstrin-like domain